jgi:hypothetical protein
VTVFGGPSFLRVKQSLVQEVTYRDLLSTIRFQGAQTAVQELSTWGINVGADVSIYLTDHVGVGALFRYVRANVISLTSADDDIVPVAIGGLNIGGGLRVRF